jgi:hypothetical protein
MARLPATPPACRFPKACIGPRAGSHQVKDANVSFVCASAPIVIGTTFIFVREPY